MSKLDLGCLVAICALAALNAHLKNYATALFCGLILVVYLVLILTTELKGEE